MSDPEVLRRLEALLKIAATGEHYAPDEYNKDRYKAIRDHVEKLYAGIYSIDKKMLQGIDPSGYITPKVGVNAVIQNEKGELLLELRKDDHAWGLPGGWAEVGLTAEENIIKELKEETGFIIRVLKNLATFCRKPDTHYLHTSYHILFSGEIVAGTLRVSHESLDIQWKRIEDVREWHVDHKAWIDHVMVNNLLK